MLFNREICTFVYKKTIKWESRRAYHRRTADTKQTRHSGEAMDETNGKIYNEQQQILAKQACRSLCHRTVA